MIVVSPYTSIAPATQQGDVIGALFAVPAGAANVSANATLNDADILSTASIPLTVYLVQSLDSGFTTTRVTDAGWTSGPGSVLLSTDTPAAPGVSYSGGDGGPLPQGASYGIEISSPDTVYFGGTVTFTDANGNIL